MEKDHHQVVTPTCPRCGSSNTKFCYYNNYSLTQPRYFCKGCRRYWTRGGSLRNVPIGGGCRKSRRGKPIRIPSKSLGQNGVESSSSFSAVCNDAVSNRSIDLAEVYANFLHPNPRQETNQVEASLPELPERINNVTRSFDQFSGFQGLNLSTLPHQGISTGFLDLSETNQLIRNETAFGYIGNIDQSINKQHFANGNFFSSLNSSTNNFVLPPLPDAVVSEGLLWPSSSMMLPNEMLHSTNPTTTRVVDVPAGQNSEVLINGSNVNPFSPLSLEAIFRS